MANVCSICPHHCRLTKGEIGICRARQSNGNEVIDLNYGRITSAALDPIEKKPLYRFYPKHWILSVGSFGCNLNCPFCQNYEISMADSNFQTQIVTPKQLVELAVDLSQKARGNIGIAFTYNEPFISYEFVRDTAILLREVGLKTVLVTNGTVARQTLLNILPLIDAMNIDLKAFNSDFYKWIGGDFETVKQTIKLSADQCHVEVTTLIIPGKNDSTKEMEEEAKWLSKISQDLPLHISRFFPRYKLLDRPPTDVDRVYSLVGVARKYLNYVYPGNC